MPKKMCYQELDTKKSDFNVRKKRVAKVAYEKCCKKLHVKKRVAIGFYEVTIKTYRTQSISSPEANIHLTQQQ